MSTKEENKRDECTQNEQQKLENNLFLEKTPPNLRKSQDTENAQLKGESDDKTQLNRDNEAERQRGEVEIKSNNNTAAGEGIALSRSQYEGQVLTEVVELLSRPAFPDGNDVGENSEEMSRLAPKPKVPGKSISRPSLSHVNSKVPGELSGQPSLRNTKDDVKYWKCREQELLDRITALETKAAVAEAAKEKFHGPPDQVAAQRQEKLEDLSGMRGPDEIISHLKSQNEELRGALAKMTAILRDKTALCVSQEKKVAALTNQVESLKEVVAITKDLLNIRNMEVQHISNDISAMETKINCERQRHNQMLIKMDEAVKLNSELKKEYENQMKLFQHLRDNYEEKIRMISQTNVIENSKDQVSDPSRSSNGTIKTATVSGKISRGSNFKVNFQDN